MKRMLLLGAGGVILLTIAAGLAERLNQPLVDGVADRAAEPVAAAGRTPVAVAPAPIQPAPASPAAVAPSFDVVRIDPSGSAVLAGRAAPGAEVTVLDAGSPIGRATADRRGEWVLLPDDPLAPGSRQLTLLAQPPDGGKDVSSDQVVVLDVPESGGKAPAGETGQDVPGETPGETQVAAAFAVAVPLGNGPSEVLQAPPAKGVTVDVVDYDNKGDVSVGGRAPAGSKVQLYLDGKPMASADADSNGQWRANPSRAIEPGTYTLRADQIGPDGRVASRAETPFQMTDLADHPPSGNMTVVQPGNSLWRLARRAYGEGTLYTVIYKANQGQIGDPDLIYPGQVFTLPEPDAARNPS